MKKYILPLLILLFSTATSAQMPPRGRSCGAVTANIETTLKIDYGMLQYDETTSTRTNDPNQLGKTEYTITQNIKTAYETRNDNCLRLAKVEVELKVDPFVVYIDKDLEKGSCLYNNVRKHENEHVRILRETLKNEGPTAKTDLMSKLATIGQQETYKNFPEKYYEARKEMDAEVETIVTNVVTQLEAKMVAKQQSIDTKAIYAKLTMECIE